MMNNKKNMLQAVGYSLVATLAVQLGSVIKTTYIVGSSIAFFSGVSVVAPLVGFFGGVVESFLVCLCRLAVHAACYGTVSFHYLAYCIPGLCAALYLASSHQLIRYWLPLALMGLVVVHPVGGAAWLYSLYWLIPVALYLFKQDGIFAQAVGSTLIAHGVGSVIFLYSTFLPASVWIALIPVVFVERLSFALGMVVVQKVYLLVPSVWKNVAEIKRACA